MPSFPQHKIIGCLMRGISALKTDHYFNEIMAGMQKEAAIANYTLLFSGQAVRSLILHASPGEEVLEAALEIRNLACGYLVDERISDTVAERIMRETGKPLVIVNRQTKLAVNAVYPDIRGAIGKLFAALKRMGYGAFIFCDSGQDTASQLEMRRCYRMMIKEFAIPDSCYRIVERTGFVPLETICSRIRNRTANQISGQMHHAATAGPIKMIPVTAAITKLTFSDDRIRKSLLFSERVPLN